MFFLIEFDIFYYIIFASILYARKFGFNELLLFGVPEIFDSAQLLRKFFYLKEFGFYF